MLFDFQLSKITEHACGSTFYISTNAKEVFVDMKMSIRF